MKKVNHTDENKVERVTESWPKWMREYQITKYSRAKEKQSESSSQAEKGYSHKGFDHPAKFAL